MDSLFYQSVEITLTINYSNACPAQGLSMCWTNKNVDISRNISFLKKCESIVY